MKQNEKEHICVSDRRAANSRPSNKRKSIEDLETGAELSGAHIGFSQMAGPEHFEHLGLADEIGQAASPEKMQGV